MKRIISLVLISIMLLSCISLSACGVSNDIDQRIREDYVAWTNKSCSPDEIEYWHCGTYRGNVALYFFNESCYFAVTEITVADIELVFPDSRQIWIWSDGTFYDMNTAYEKGLIGYFDIYAMYYRYELEFMIAHN